MIAVRIKRAPYVAFALIAVVGGFAPHALAQNNSAKSSGAAGRQAAKTTARNARATPKAKDPMSVLFLTPGGRYTEADIRANGRKTVAQKYPGFMAAHDPKPQPGDRVCPITDTKANPKLTWVVGGKTYPFCCPPCVVEFVKKAKTNPASIKEPAAYVKK